jgi:acetyltransferase-like isoleucine patch superfamily enzyme
MQELPVAEPSSHGLPSNPYNAQCWITGTPEIGEGTWIGAFTLIDGQGGLKIGRYCDISSGSQILTHSTVRRCLSEGKYNKVDRSPTILEDHVFVGTNAVILMGSYIGHHSIVAAGAVVLEGSKISPFSLVAGVPARIIRSIREEVDRWKAEGGETPCHA